MEESSEPLPDGIYVEGFADQYYVGETFNDTYHFGHVEVIYNSGAKKKDITDILKGNVTMTLKDGSGNEVDMTAPFSKTGNYTLSMCMTRQPTLKTADLTLKVSTQPSAKTLIAKSTPNGIDMNAVSASFGDNFSFPAKGDVPALVIPLEFDDFPFAGSPYGVDYMDAIDRLYNGSGSSETGYWESVASYYRTVSRGELRFDFEIADVYKPGRTTSDILPLGTGGAFNYVAGAVANYLNKMPSGYAKKFDLDHDGYLDGVWVIYSAPDYASHDYGVQDPTVMWAFCSDYSGIVADVENPKLHSFGWTSIAFATEGTEAPNVDAHTFIHETGHLLGLPDFYSYDLNAAKSSGIQGGLAMMDLNIGDQDPYSKLALGWGNPFLTPDEDAIITLRPNHSSGDCLILADHWNGTAFDEYLLVDFVTPEGINENDATTAYANRPLYFSKPGIRMYHVDARLGEFKYVFATDGRVEREGLNTIMDPGAKDAYMSDARMQEVAASGKVTRLGLSSAVSYEERPSGFAVINDNSPSRCAIGEKPYINNRLLAFVGKDGMHSEIDDRYASNDDLFDVGDGFRLNEKYFRHFSYSLGKLNNGADLDVGFTVLSLDNGEAKLLIHHYGEAQA